MSVLEQKLLPRREKRELSADVRDSSRIPCATVANFNPLNDSASSDCVESEIMKRIFFAASIYLVLGLASGLYYREFTKSNDYTATDGFTQLSVVHTHILTLGVIVLLIVLALEKVFALSRSKAFSWFFWVYNLGLIITASLLTINGTLHVLGIEPGKALAGISGSGHILLTAGLILLFFAIWNRIKHDTTQSPQSIDAAAGTQVL